MRCCRWSTGEAKETIIGGGRREQEKEEREREERGNETEDMIVERKAK